MMHDLMRAPATDPTPSTGPRRGLRPRHAHCRARRAGPVHLDRRRSAHARRHRPALLGPSPPGGRHDDALCRPGPARPRRRRAPADRAGARASGGHVAVVPGTVFSEAGGPPDRPGPAWACCARTSRRTSPAARTRATGTGRWRPRRLPRSSPPPWTAGACCWDRRWRSTSTCGSHQRLLDIAGGSAIYACSLAARFPHLRASVLEKPPVDRIAARAIEARGFSERVQVITRRHARRAAARRARRAPVFKRAARLGRDSRPAAAAGVGARAAGGRADRRPRGVSELPTRPGRFTSPDTPSCCCTRVRAGAIRSPRWRSWLSEAGFETRGARAERRGQERAGRGEEVSRASSFQLPAELRRCGRTRTPATWRRAPRGPPRP